MSTTAQDLHALALERAGTGDLEDVREQIVQLFESARASVAPPPPPRLTVAPPPPPSLDVPPPPPPVAPSQVWAALTEEHSDPSDPIASFAPPPSMDWGPERMGRFRRRKG